MTLGSARLSSTVLFVAPMLTACAGRPGAGIDAARRDATPADTVGSAGDTIGSLGEMSAIADARFASPPNLPQVPNNGGATFTSPNLVAVSYSGDPNGSYVATFINAWVTSSEFAATLGEYGITGGTFGGSYTLAGPAPTGTLSDTEIQQILAAGIASGALPPPTVQTLYHLTLPKGTDVGCPTEAAYHSYSTLAGGFAYAVDALCPGFGAYTDNQWLTADASHEIAEVATDPLSSGRGYAMTWASSGGEIADLCGYFFTSWGSYTIQRIYSNQQARAMPVGGDPCVPLDTTTPFFDGGPLACGPITVNPGAGQRVTVSTYATAPLAPPPLCSTLRLNLSVTPPLTVSPQTAFVVPGEAVDVIVSAPAGTAASSNLGLHIETASVTGPYTNLLDTWDAQVIVP